MPYLIRKYRLILCRLSSKIQKTTIEAPGWLNYIFTCTILAYVKVKGESYQTYNDIIGALECCKLELYRRKVAKYEDKKITENGDVY